MWRPRSAPFYMYLPKNYMYLPKNYLPPIDLFKQKFWYYNWLTFGAAVLLHRIFIFLFLFFNRVARAWHGDISPFIAFCLLLRGSVMTWGHFAFHPWRADRRNVPKSCPTWCLLPVDPVLLALLGCFQQGAFSRHQWLRFLFRCLFPAGLLRSLAVQSAGWVERP